MSSPRIQLRALAGLALLGAGLAGCGSQTKTVSAGGSASQPLAGASTSPAPAKPSTPAGQTSTGSTATTRSAPEPAFTESAHREGVGAAVALLKTKGYQPVNTADYRSNQALAVLIGLRSGSGDGYGQQAFFFVNGRYIGTDTSQPSAAVKVVSQGDTEVTLAYPLYRSGDPLCCPGGGQARVRFQLNNGRLTALDPIPPLSSKTGLSRY
jgi:hypothetical protein